MTILEACASLRALEQKATPGPWEFRGGIDQNGDSCDLLMAEIGIAAGDEDPEYAEVLFGQELSEQERAANWELCAALRNLAPTLLPVLEALLEALLEERAARERSKCYEVGEYDMQIADAEEKTDAALAEAERRLEAEA
jgi:hypothetical protein